MKEITGRLFVDGELVHGTLRLENGRIASVVTTPDAPGCTGAPIVAPGFCDLHVHGFGGADPLEDLAGMTRKLANVGTTSFLPTLFPDEPAALGRTAEGLWSEAQKLPVGRGARVLGLHLEGPFVNPRSAGALPPERLAAPSVEALRDVLGPSTGDAHGIRTVTLAPELSGSPALVEELVRSGVRVSLGHSLATAAEARSAARAGACSATHLFNAMSGVHHRDAGLATFALSSDALNAEIIGDLVHVGPEAFELALRARGPLGLSLVSDALWGAGSGCDVFHSHGHRCVLADGAAWIEEEPGAERRLAGAAASQLEALRRLVAAGVVGVADGLLMASESPARALGLEDEVGRLVVGARADLVVLSGELELLETLVGGESIR